MKRLTALLFGLLGLFAGLIGSVPKASAQTACNLLCIQGYHCCIFGQQPRCVPDSQACP